MTEPLDEILERYRRDPVAFARELFGDAQPWQLALLEKLARGEPVLISGGRGGKRVRQALRMAAKRLEGE